MTYIVGLRAFGLNAIIADARESWLSPCGVLEGENRVLKTGVLFPGCIFGRAGNASASRRFALLAKAFVNSGKGCSPLQAWDRLRKFVDDYDFPRDPSEHFEMLLSSRHLDVPTFFVLDSESGLHELDADVITKGSGREPLDPIVLTEFSHRLAFLEQQAGADDPNPSLRHQAYPYLFCLWLNEISTSYERVELEERYAVGGLFHFISQDSEGDYQQQPALYVFCDPDLARKRIYSWQYRVCFVRDCLVVDKMIPPCVLSEAPNGRQERTVFLDYASLPPGDPRIIQTPVTVFDDL